MSNLRSFITSPDPFTWLAVLVTLVCMGCDDGVQGAESAAPQVVKGCGEAQLYALPSADKPGPWPVGVRTVEIAGLTVEVFYPATRGAEVGQAQATYDLRQWLPEAEKEKIPDDQAPTQVCDCHRDLPIDAALGPYPVMVFIHGTAAFRTQSLAQMTHWASRGMIVLTADHPKIFLQDALQLKLGADQVGDARALFKAVRDGDPALAFLEGRADPTQMSASGHSAGGNACGQLGDEEGVRVLIPMASGGVSPKNPVDSSLVLMGQSDATVPPSATEEGYADTQGRKRLVGLDNAGHLVFSQLCEIAGDAGDLYSLALKWKITIPPGTGALFEKLATDGCNPEQLRGEAASVTINHVTSAVLEETLRCQQTDKDPLATVEADDPNISRYEASLAAP